GGQVFEGIFTVGIGNANRLGRVMLPVVVQVEVKRPARDPRLIRVGDAVGIAIDENAPADGAVDVGIEIGLKAEGGRGGAKESGGGEVVGRTAADRHVADHIGRT